MVILDYPHILSLYSVLIRIRNPTELQLTIINIQLKKPTFQWTVRNRWILDSCESLIFKSNQLLTHITIEKVLHYLQD